MDHKIYLTDRGIFKKGSKFYYHKNSRQVIEPEILERLGKIYTPPAWKNVWFASNPKSHVQVHGIDQGGKKQYILSEKWTANARYTKYIRMKSFMKDIASFKRKIKLENNILDYNNLIKLLFNLLMDIHLRVGNEKYAENNGSYGLTTLRQKHYINGTFVFTGKSGIDHEVPLPENYHVFLKKLKLSDKNGPLFWYPSKNKIKTISSEELNVFLKNHMGKDYTCKDFRTYSANVVFIKSFLKNKNSKESVKKIILKSIDESAKELGHSRSISRKSYISDNLLNYCLDSFQSASEESVASLLSRV
jgi:DNA topoisomerase-1